MSIRHVQFYTPRSQYYSPRRIFLSLESWLKSFPALEAPPVFRSQLRLCSLAWPFWPCCSFPTELGKVCNSLSADTLSGRSMIFANFGRYSPEVSRPNLAKTMLRPLKVSADKELQSLPSSVGKEQHGQN